jgi:hypothetical protein
MRLQVSNKKAGCTSPTQNSSLACNISHPEWPQEYRSVKQELLSNKEERYNASVTFINVNVMSRHTQHDILFQGCKWHLYFKVIIKNSGVRPALHVLILTVLLLVGCGWLASTTIPGSFSAEQPCLTIVVSSAQLTLLLPVWEQAGSHYCNSKIQNMESRAIFLEHIEYRLMTKKFWLTFSFPEFVLYTVLLQKPTVMSLWQKG